MLKQLMGLGFASLMALGLAACDSEDARLKSAIAQNLAAEGNPLACAPVMNEVGGFPFAWRSDGMLNHGADKNTLDQLVKGGFLTSRPIKVASVYGGLNGETVGSPDAIEYAVTPMGSKFVQGNRFCIPNELADTDVEADGSRRALLVTQYVAGVRSPEAERLVKILAPLNPNLARLLDEDLPIRFSVRTSAKFEVLTVQKVS